MAYKHSNLFFSQFWCLKVQNHNVHRAVLLCRLSEKKPSLPLLASLVVATIFAFT